MTFIEFAEVKSPWLRPPPTMLINITLKLAYLWTVKPPVDSWLTLVNKGVSLKSASPVSSKTTSSVG
jgi:hypothetical protein